MANTVKIIFVRHGETVGNVSGIVQGQTGGTLTERGRRQAQSAAKSLAGTHIDAAYTSDLGRALDTARIVLEGRDGIILTSDKRLREQDLGVYVGGPVAKYSEAMTLAGTVREKFDPEKGETSGAMRGRVKEFLDDMAAGYPGGMVLAVTHQGVMRMVADMTGLDIRAVNAEPVMVEYENEEAATS